MKISQEKQKKLAYVARRYYLEDQRQSDIAKELGVSRPMVSRMLAEARELGVVEITVHDAGTRTATLLERLRLSTSVRGGVLVEDGADEDATNQLLSHVWGWDSDVDCSVVWVHISNIRKKLARLGAPAGIRFLRGAGYVLEVAQ